MRDTGCEVGDLRNTMRDKGNRIRDTRYEMRDQARAKVPYFPSRIPYHASRIPYLASFLLSLLLCAPSFAHESRPAYLEIKETAPGQYSVLWRTPVLAGMRLPLVLKLPDDVKNLKAPVVQELTDSLVERRSIDAGPMGSQANGSSSSDSN